MRRRTLLSTLGTAASAGCIGSQFASTSEERAYEQCDRDVISYSSFPADVQAEIDAALNEGRYKTDGSLLLTDTMNVNQSYVKKDGSYYAAEVKRTNGMTVLQLEVDSNPRLSSVRKACIENKSDVEPVTITVTVSDSGEIIVEQTVTVEPGDENCLPATDVIGTYVLRVETEDGRSNSFDWSVSSSGFDAFIVVAGDGEIDMTQAVASQGPCTFGRE